MSKSKTKSSEKKCSVRIDVTAKGAAKALLKKANDKEFGRSVKFDELVALALGLVKAEHLTMLQEASMSNEDRKEHLRQIYIEKNGQISKDAFTGFMMTAEFQRFISEHGPSTSSCFSPVSSVA